MEARQQRVSGVSTKHRAWANWHLLYLCLDLYFIQLHAGKYSLGKSPESVRSIYQTQTDYTTGLWPLGEWPAGLLRY